MGTNQLWPYLLALGAVPYLLQFILSFWTPESPIYLISKGQIEQAKISKEQLKGALAILPAHQKEFSKQTSTNMLKNIYQIFKDSPVRKATLVCIFLMIFQQFCGINAISFYSGSIFLNAGIPQDYAGLATVGLGIFNLFFLFFAIWVSDRAGRKALLEICYGVICACCILMTILLSFPDNTFASYLTIAPVAIFVAAYLIAPGPIPWTAASESIPVNYKTGSQALACVVNCLGAFLIGVIFPPMQEAIGQYSFLPFAVVSFSGIVYVWFFMVETRGRNVEEIQEEYRK